MRRAFNFAFDFEEMNKQLFFGQYKRINSYFDGTELASSGLPQGQELEILETVRDKVPAEVFTTPYQNPVGGNPEAVRANLRESARLLKEAGYEIRDRKLVDAAGKPVTVEILVQDPSSERIVLFYKPSLERIGVTTSIRIVDDAQYQNRLRSFDFDMIIDHWGESLSPGNEQREYWGSQAADRARLAEYHRHQESGGRCADRQGDLRQGPRRAGGGDQGAGPRAVVEFLRRAAIHLSASRATRAGTASATPSRCRNTAFRTAGIVVVRRRQGRQDRQAVLRDFPRMALFSRRHVLGLGVGALGASLAAACDVGRCRHRGSWHVGVRRSEISGRLSSFRLRQSAAPKGGMFSLIPSVRAYNQSYQTFNSFNAYILKGEGAQGMDMTFAPLMVRAGDEPDAMYGLVAKSVQISADKLTYRFTLRPEAQVSRRLEADGA